MSGPVWAHVQGALAFRATGSLAYSTWWESGLQMCAWLRTAAGVIVRQAAPIGQVVAGGQRVGVVGSEHPQPVGEQLSEGFGGVGRVPGRSPPPLGRRRPRPRSPRHTAMLQAHANAELTSLLELGRGVAAKLRDRYLPAAVTAAADET